MTNKKYQTKADGMSYKDHVKKAIDKKSLDPLFVKVPEIILSAIKNAKNRTS